MERIDKTVEVCTACGNAASRLIDLLNKRHQRICSACFHSFERDEPTADMPLDLFAAAIEQQDKHFRHDVIKAVLLAGGLLAGSLALGWALSKVLP